MCRSRRCDSDSKRRIGWSRRKRRRQCRHNRSAIVWIPSWPSSRITWTSRIARSTFCNAKWVLFYLSHFQFPRDAVVKGLHSLSLLSFIFLSSFPFSSTFHILAIFSRTRSCNICIRQELYSSCEESSFIVIHNSKRASIMREDCRFEADNFHKLNFLITRAAVFSPSSEKKFKRKSKRVRQNVFSYHTKSALRKIFMLVQIIVSRFIVILRKNDVAGRATKRGF